MAQALVEITPDRIPDNPWQAIGQGWMLITAGTLEHYNVMTASWGAWGHLWEREVCFCFVRPQRHTFGFMEASAYYTLSFFDESHRAALDFCGNHSGRDVDKAAATGLTAVAGTTGAVYFAQARLVFECRKLYAGDILPEAFADKTIPAEVYSKRDFHRMYVGQIVRCLARR